jgi:hypothetical protein
VAATITVKGVPELHRSLRTLENDLRDLSTVNADVARDLVAAVSARAPRKSGRLAGSFTATGSRDKATASSSLDYAGVQEYGSAGHNIEGKHFAEAALEASAGGAEAKYRNGVERLCRKAEK